MLGDFTFRSFGFFLADRQTESNTESHTDEDDRYTHATAVGVNKYTT